MAGRHVILNTPDRIGQVAGRPGAPLQGALRGQDLLLHQPDQGAGLAKSSSPCATTSARERRDADRRRQHQPRRAGDLLHGRGACPTWLCAAARCSTPPYVVMDEFHYYSDAERGVCLAGPPHHPAAHALPADVRHPRRHQRHRPSTSRPVTGTGRGPHPARKTAPSPSTSSTSRRRCTRPWRP